MPSSKALPPRKLRVALYSHDTKGLGHTRRNLLIAQTLAHSPLQPTVLMICGTRAESVFAMPRGVDWVTLPAIRKSTTGEYYSRGLDVSLPELVALRAKVIQAALEGFQADVLIVDNVPRGAVRELDPALALQRVHGRTRCVLGLRDVLDEPEAVQREWRRTASADAIRDYYDAVWVYGDPQVYDLAREYHFPPEVVAKLRYTGYLDQCLRLTSAESERPDSPTAALALPPGRFALCLVGGGQDGAHLAEAFAQAELPPALNGVLLTGPFMPPEVQQRLHRWAAHHPRLRVLEFIPEPASLIRGADRVIAMGGYNTVCEVLSYEKPALIVPCLRPRREQWIRAERLHALGLLDVLHPDAISPRALTAWLRRDLGAPPQVRERIDLNGLARLPDLLADVLAACSRPIQNGFHNGELRHAAL